MANQSLCKSRAESRTSRGFGGTQYTHTSRSVHFHPHDSSGNFISLGQPILVPNFSVSHRADILGIGTGLNMFILQPRMQESEPRRTT